MIERLDWFLIIATMACVGAAVGFSLAAILPTWREAWRELIGWPWLSSDARDDRAIPPMPLTCRPPHHAFVWLGAVSTVQAPAGTVCSCGQVMLDQYGRPQAVPTMGTTRFH